MKPFRFFAVALCTLLACSCSVTRHLGPGEYLLGKNEVRVEKDKSVPRKERADREELARYIEQRPNKRLLGYEFFLSMYNLSNPEKTNWWNNGKRRIGEEPVIYNPDLTELSAEHMERFLESRGFFSSTVSYRTDTVRRKINVRYDVVPDQPSRLGTIERIYLDRFLEPILAADTLHSLLRTGDPYNEEVLRAERLRIVDVLKNQGYYDFSVNSISYEADSVSDPRTIHLKMLLKQKNAGFDRDGTPILENNAVYRLRNVYVITDAPSGASTDSAYLRSLDTVEYRGVKFLYRGRLNVKPEVLMRAIDLYPNDLYRMSEVNRAYNTTDALNYSVNILFTKIEDTTGRNIVTFIGEETGDGEVLFTEEKYVDCSIYCTPGPRQSYTVNTEGTTTSSYYGMLLTLGYQNRNIFKGIELLEVSLTGGYEFMRTKRRKNSVEIGGSVALTFPRFLAPVRIDRYNRMNHPRTRAEVSYNIQNRPYYKRELSSATLGYSWSNNRYSSFIVRPVDLSLIKMHSVDSEFLDSIANIYLKESYTSQLLVGISAAYVYNNQNHPFRRNIFRLRVNMETNGNLLNLIARSSLDKKSGEDYYRIFGIRYAQYFRTDADVSYRMPTGERTSFVVRLYGGLGTPYGNSKGYTLPFERLFYAGGANSMRGWQARTLGPGNSPMVKSGEYPSKLGNVKLEANAEFRFPVYRFLNGAVFTDVGNVWNTPNVAEGEHDVFRFNRFYKQLGFNGGLGARFDFGYFLFRLDWGVQLHNPNENPGSRWIRNLTLNQTTFSFNVGYPF